MGKGLDRLVFNAAEAADSANVGAFLRDAAGNLLTSTLIGADQALDVNVVGLAGQYAEDSAHVSGDLGQQMLAVRQDADGSLVSADGDYAPLQVDAEGFLKVAGKITVEAGDAEYLEDSAHTTGDAGLFMLNVREDTLAASTSASGDYQAFKSDALGRQYVNSSGQSAAYDSTGMTDVAALIIPTPLANRTKVLMQNVGNKIVYIGTDNLVDETSGIAIAPGSSIEVEAGPQINWYGITESGVSDMRYLEVA